jgi:NAD(P)-dependent dehydrogenase (short-subunit alcohol dehydrogenase family)
MRLAGTHAVVTGGGTGIGAAIAKALAAEGANLTLIGRGVEPLEAMARSLPSMIAAAADVTDGAALAHAIGLGRDRYGPVTILINNAGFVETAPFPGFTETDIVAGAADRIGEKTGRSGDEARDALARFNPQGRLVITDEVASAVLWLCLPESAAITGQAISVSGGEVG